MPAGGHPFLPRPARGEEPVGPLSQQGQLREVFVRKKNIERKGRIRITVLFVFFSEYLSNFRSSFV